MTHVPGKAAHILCDTCKTSTVGTLTKSGTVASWFRNNRTVAGWTGSLGPSGRVDCCPKCSEVAAPNRNVVTIQGLRLRGSQNVREHHMARHRRVKGERALAFSACVMKLRRPALPCVVLLTRIGRGKLDPGENLPGSCKAVVDSVAKWLGVDDGDETKVRLEYAQEVGSYAVRIEILGPQEGV